MCRLRLHPDKQTGKSAEEVEAAREQFDRMTVAYDILSDLPTRREYDRARDGAEAGREAERYLGSSHFSDCSLATCSL